MPGELCPACGAVRTAAGCACHPDVTETAVLPIIEGPPLVRPYVPAVTVYPDQPEEAYDAASEQVPAPAAPIPPPPAEPPAMTTTQTTAAMAAGGATEATSLLPAPRELGLFPIATAPVAGPGRAAARRAGRPGSGRPGSGRTLAIIGGGAGIVALGIGLALAMAPAPDAGNTALPAPTTAPSLGSSDTPSAAPSDPATSAPGSATAKSVPPTSAAPHTKAAARPTPSPTSTSPAAVPPPVSTAPPSTPPPPTSASPSPSATPQTLGLGDTGPAVKALQQQLLAANCGKNPKMRVTSTYDIQTMQAVQSFQWAIGIWQEQEQGTAGPLTQAALAAGKTCTN